MTTLIIVIVVVALFVRFVAAAFMSGSKPADHNARVRDALEALRAVPRSGSPVHPGQGPASPIQPAQSVQGFPPALVPPIPASPPNQTPVPPPAPTPDNHQPEVPAILHGPQLVPLSADQQSRVLELMDQGFEVMAVRLVCDETRAGILDAQKTVRTLAGLPSPY